jgi:aquaporin Z
VSTRRRANSALFASLTLHRPSRAAPVIPVPLFEDVGVKRGDAWDGVIATRTTSFSERFYGYAHPGCKKPFVWCGQFSHLGPLIDVEALMSLRRRALAEFIGTFWLVFGGCGSAVLAAGFPGLGIGFLGVALAFGLTVLTMAYAIGHISGCHLNPAVSIGLAVGRRFPAGELFGYIGAQLIGGVVAAAILYLIASGRPEFDLAAGFAANGYGLHSPGQYSLLSGALAEIVLTFMFLMIIFGATDERAPKGFAPIAIGLGLTLVNLVGIPVTNMSVNPARSTGPALIVGGWAMEQLWLFWLAPIAGAVLAGLVYPVLAGVEAANPFKPRSAPLDVSPARG